MREINIGNPEQLSNSERMLYNIANNSSIKTDPPNSRVEKLLEQIMANSGSSALKFIGITTTEIEDESTTSPVIINGAEVTPDNGDIVFYNKGEYVWDGSKWRLLGDNITYAYYTENTTAQTAAFSGQKHFEINGDAQYPNTFTNNYNIAFGVSNTVKGKGAFAMGASNTVSGEYAMAQGINSYSTGEASHAEGKGAYAEGKYAHAEGQSTTAPGDASHAEGYSCYSIGTNSHAEGDSCYSPGQAAHAEGSRRYAIGHAAHAEGVGNGSFQAKGEAAHAEGYQTQTDGTAAHAEGYQTSAMAQGAHTEGYSTAATGSYSHAEGYQTGATGYSSHVEGYKSHVNGDYSHGEGYNNTVGGTYYNHAEGSDNTINSNVSNSHVEGHENVVNSSCSHVGGWNNIAGSNYQTVIGKYNESDTNNVYSFIVGNGTYDNNRRNGFTVKWDGTAQVGANPVNDMDIVTKKYADDNYATVHHSASAPTALEGRNGDIWYKMSVGTLGELEEIIAVYTKYDDIWYENKDNNTTYTAGENITIDANNVISATNTTYTAGENITIDANNVISATISGGTGTPFVMVNNSTVSQHWEASLPNVTSISTGFTVLVANMGSGVYTSEVVDFNLTYNNSDSTGAVPVYVSKGTGISERLLAGNTIAPEVFMLMFFKANEYSINGTVQAASKWVVVGIS